MLRLKVDTETSITPCLMKVGCMIRKHVWHRGDRGSLNEVPEYQGTSPQPVPSPPNLGRQETGDVAYMLPMLKDPFRRDSGLDVDMCTVCKGHQHQGGYQAFVISYRRMRCTTYIRTYLYVIWIKQPGAGRHRLSVLTWIQFRFVYTGLNHKRRAT